MTVSLSCAVMATEARRAWAEELCHRLGIGLDRVSWSEPGPRGKLDTIHDVVWRTCRGAWEMAEGEYHLVVQDDAIVCDSLLPGLAAGLGRVPEEAVVSLYVGHNASVAVQRAAQLAGPMQAGWLVVTKPRWGVATAVRRAAVLGPGGMLEQCDAFAGTSDDRRISKWAGHRAWPTWVPWPGLVDHRDGPSLMGHGAGRTALRFAGTDYDARSWDWQAPVSEAPDVRGVYRRAKLMRRAAEREARLRAYQESRV